MMNFILNSSHAQAVAAKAARQKDRQQNFGSKTRNESLNVNQVKASNMIFNGNADIFILEQNTMDINYLYVTR